MRFLFAVIVLVLLAFAPAYGQTTTVIDLGSQPTFGWDHDGANTTHYAFYLQTGTATPQKIGEIAKSGTAGTVEAVYPVKFATVGTYKLYVTAINKSTDPNVDSGESPLSVALPIDVKRAKLPLPNTPLNLRLVVKVAADGRVEFYIASID